eukprot:9501345-Pyramimonas_sp.AAC.1
MLFDPAVKELIREVQSGHQSAGVDVQSEGEPPPEAWSNPVPAASRVEGAQSLPPARPPSLPPAGDTGSSSSSSGAT